MPRVMVQEMIEVIDACIEGIPYVPTDEANLQARGLGSMVALWERTRNICPKVNLYHGPIYGKDGEQCTTSSRLCSPREISGFRCLRRVIMLGNRFLIAMLLGIPGRWCIHLTLMLSSAPCYIPKTLLLVLMAFHTLLGACSQVSLSMSWWTTFSRKRPRRVLLRKALPSKTAEVMAVLKDCHQRLPKWSLSIKIVIKDCPSDHCL